MKTTDIKTAIACICVLFTFNSRSQGSGEIRGIIKNTDLEAIPFATIKILQGNQLVGGTQSNAEGRYSYKPLNPGSYELVVMEPGHITQPVNKIKVIPNEATYVDVKLSINMLGTVTVTAKPIDYTMAGVDRSMYSMKSLDAKELMENASYNRGDIKGAMAAITSDAIESPNGDIHFRGARGDASAYYVDGVRTLAENTIPGMGIENVTVFSGGVPAMYGDVTSGVVIITTKSYFSGIRDKNLRIADAYERKAEEKARQKAREDEEKRLMEIEQEKATEKLKD